MYKQYQQSIQAPIDINSYKTIHQERPSTTVSDKYRFIPTKGFLSVLQDFGWFPVGVNEARTRIEENQGFQKHAIRFCNNELNQALEVGSTIPQILLTNSHSGTASFCLNMALLEKVCSNGLLVARESQQVARIPHRGYIDAKVAKALVAIVSQIPKTLTEIELYKSIKLNSEEQRLYAQAAIELRFDGEKYAVPESEVLFAKRSAQREPTLWNTYNVVQEALIRGGVRQRRKDGSCIRSRAITSIDENIRLNKALWLLTATVATRRC